MKKLISILGAVTLCSSSAFSVVSCTSNSSNAVHKDAISLSNVVLDSKNEFYQSAKITSWDGLLNFAWNLLKTDTKSGINWNEVKQEQLNITIYDTDDYVLDSSDIAKINTLDAIKIKYTAIANYPNQIISGSTKEFVINNWDDDLFSKEFTDYFSKTNFVLPGEDGGSAQSAFGDSLSQIQKDPNLGALASNADMKFSIVADSFKPINNSGDVVGHDNDKAPLKGTLSINIKDLKNNVDVMNKNDQTKNFVINFSNDKTEDYMNLYQKLNSDVSTDEAGHSVNIRSFTLAQLLPAKYLVNIKPEIQKLLNAMDIGEWIVKFFDPINGFAKDLPKVMPDLSQGAKWLDDPKNVGCLTFAHDFSNFFKDKYGIDITKGDFASNVRIMNGKSPQGYDMHVDLDFDTYNVIKNIMPDLIHFHNYLLTKSTYRQGAIKDVQNYMLEFLKYISMPVDKNLSDGFNDVNKQYKTPHSRPWTKHDAKKGDSMPASIKYNFDNFLYDLTTSFTTSQGNAGFKTLFNISATVSHYGDHTDTITADSFDRIFDSSDQNDPYYSPYNMVLKSTIDKMFKNQGQDITQDISIQPEISLNFGTFSTWEQGDVSMPAGISLLDVHQGELKRMITDTLGFKNLASDDITITKGTLVAEYQRGGNEWIQANALDDLLNQDTTSLRFKMKDMSFSVTDKADPSIKIIKNGYTMYLNF